MCAQFTVHGKFFYADKRIFREGGGARLCRAPFHRLFERGGSAARGRGRAALSFSHFFTARLDKCGFVVYDYITGRGASRRGSAFHLIAGVDL